jgi:outer membrane biosynthesis protein TonB
VKLQVDKTIVASVALHVLVIGWGLISFSSRALEVVPEALPVDIISSADLSKMTAGLKNGQKDKPKPLVEKVADAKPVDEAVGKIDDKKPEVVTSTSTPEPPPKPVEKKPDVKPKEEPKQAEKKPEPPKPDPIAEALKSDEAKKPKPKQEAKVTPPPQPQKPKERIFDQSKIANLLDKRDPTRQSITGAALNPTSSLGTHTGNSDSRVATWKGAFVGAVRRCFNFPYNGQDADQFEVDLDINMKLDGTLASTPVIVAVRGPSKSVADAMGESARRAVQQCAAYSFLPKEQYETWKYIPMTFGLRDLM